MRVRALLIFNPQATSTTRPVLDLIVRSLAARVEVETVETRYRGHAGDLAAAAVTEGRDAVLVLSGDGTINEVVNGLMRGASARAGQAPPVPTAGRLPPIAALPGGYANVFARALGLPADPAAAVERIGSHLAAGKTRTIGLGMAGDRYFTFNAGLGGTRKWSGPSRNCAPAAGGHQPACTYGRRCGSTTGTPTAATRPSR